MPSDGGADPKGPVELAIVSRRMVTEDGVRAAAVWIGGGKITAVTTAAEVPAGVPVRDYGDLVVMAALVDTHVHVNEPGRTEWEGFHTATRAAAAGGITTLVDMPLNCIPVTTTRAALDVKRRAIDGLLWVDCGFWGGVVPGNAGELDGLVDDGVMGFKCFLVHSGIDEFPEVTAADLDRAMPILAARGVPLLAHAEVADHLLPPPAGASVRYADWLASRPREAEDVAIRRLIEWSRKHGCAVHIVHLSSASALPYLAAARAEGLPITVETCPHYLTLDAEDVPDGETRYKCAPPIRERANRELLWHGLRDGIIDFIVSDHSPCTPHLKCLEAGDFLGAWGGIASVQLTLPVVWSEARRRGIHLARIAEWMSARPAAFAGLGDRKGRLAVGHDADVVVWDPDATFVVEPEKLYFRHKLTPYAGRTLHGEVRCTYLRGDLVYGEGHFADAPRGRTLTRTQS